VFSQGGDIRGYCLRHRGTVCRNGAIDAGAWTAFVDDVLSGMFSLAGRYHSSDCAMVSLVKLIDPTFFRG